MKKIAFTIFRYDEGIFGGTEAHCRMLAERLCADYEVEVLTTTIRTSGIPAADFPPGVCVENGVTIRRFPTAPVDPARKGELNRRAKGAKRLRYRLDQAGLLAPLAELHPRWTCCRERERRLFGFYEEYSPAMQRFIREHCDDYAILLIGYYITSGSIPALHVPEKCIFIPTAHPEKPLYYATYTEIFTRVRHIAFNTAAEQRLCRRIFGRGIAPNSIVGLGIVQTPPADWEQVRARFSLPERYVLYVGRVHPAKLGTVVRDFLRYELKHGSDPKLVLAGPPEPTCTVAPNPEIVLTDAVSEVNDAAR